MASVPPFSDDDVLAAFPEMDVQTPPLGVGGQKVAYRAVDGGDVALKVMLWKASNDGEENAVTRERFQREVSGMTATSCPHLIQVIKGPDVRVVGAGPHFWYTEPFLAGGTLKARLASGPLQADEVVTLARAVLAAIDAMWSQGAFVHRDIKPANIGFLADDTPVLLDLGIALFTDMSPLTESSLSGPGTSKYAAPEQFVPRRMASIDFRTDLFQLGIVLVEALTGTHPFFRPGTDYMARLTTFDAKTLDGIDMPDGLRNLIPRLLAAEPSGRFRRVDMAISMLEGS